MCVCLSLIDNISYVKMLRDENLWVMMKRNLYSWVTNIWCA